METDALVRDLIVLALRRGDYSPLVCKNIQEIRASLEHHHPQAIVIDTFLQGANGLDLLEQLHQEGSLQGIPVVLVSSLAFSEIVKRAASLGVAAFLAKPLDTDLLLEQMEKVVKLG